MLLPSDFGRSNCGKTHTRPGIPLPALLLPLLVFGMNLAMAPAAGPTSQAASAPAKGPAVTLKPGQRLIFLGDFALEGHGYPTVVADYLALRRPELKTDVRAIGSEQLWKMSRGVEMHGRPFLRPLTSAAVAPMKGDAVVVAFGFEMASQPYRQVTFDYFLKYLDSAVADLRQGGSQVVLMTPAYFPPAADANLDMLSLAAGAIRDRAAAGGLALIDLYEHTRAAQRADAQGPPLSEIKERTRGLTPAGHSLAAGLVLEALVGPPPPCQATIHAATGKVDGQGCQVADVKATPDEVTFRRKDDALPAPLSPDAAAGLKDPSCLKDLNAYRLVVTGLKAGSWKLRVEANDVGTFTAEQLAEGVELAGESGPWQGVAAAVHEWTVAQEVIVDALAKTVQAPAMPEEAQPQRQALADKMESLIGARQQARVQAATAPAWTWTLKRAE